MPSFTVRGWGFTQGTKNGLGLLRQQITHRIPKVSYCRCRSPIAVRRANSWEGDAEASRPIPAAPCGLPQPVRPASMRRADWLFLVGGKPQEDAGMVLNLWRRLPNYLRVGQQLAILRGNNSLWNPVRDLLAEAKCSMRFLCLG